MKMMKKLFMFLCIVIIFFGIAGCPGDDEANSVAPQSFNSTPVTSPPSGAESSDAGPSAIPEPTTLILLGSGLVGLVAIRKKLKK
jgi:hypothetical protein